MRNSKVIKGVVPVLVTPILKDGSIDAEGLKRLVEFLVNKKIGGLWVLGTGSEDMNLSFKKRLEVARIVSEANAGRVHLMMGASFFGLEEIIDFIRETSSLEINSYHVMPYHLLLSLERLEWFYKHIADNCPKPLWMYTSANWSRQVTPEFISKLKNHSNIAGIKFSTRNIVDVTKVLMLASDNFQVLTAVATQLYPCLCVGSQAHTTSEASCMPEIFIKIYELFQEGEHEEALKEQQRFIRFQHELPIGPSRDNFLRTAEEKYILSLRGICNEYTTSYYRDLTDDEKQIIKRLIKEYDILLLNE